MEVVTGGSVQRLDLDALRRHAEAAGWRTEPGATIPYGEQLVIRAGPDRAVANFWPKRGTLSIQGPASPLLDALLAWQAEQASRPGARAASEQPLVLPHIGIDEAGKGDWFGPLVVAAVDVDARTAELLQLLGVRDSKRLGSSALGEVATRIEQVVDQTRRRVLMLAPRDLNRAYATAGNLNVLLADLHAEAASILSQVSGTTQVVCDQFASSGERLDVAFARRGLPAPVQLHHAEAASIAVAAASVLAAAAFRAALQDLGRAVGLRDGLPAGSSDLPRLEAALRRIRAAHGDASLADYAKLYFKPVRERLSRAPSTDERPPR
jgi:ribonuclease HIII